MTSGAAVNLPRPRPSAWPWSLGALPSRRASDVLALPALAASALVYAAVTRNYFFADDFLNLYNIANYSLLRYLLTPNGGHLLVVRNAVFYLTSLLAGTHPEPYFWSALLVHLLNVWLLFRLIRVYTDSAHLASFGAALWGVSPQNEGALGYYAVFGHVLAASALLVILLQAATLAARGGVPSPTKQALWYALALAGATSFGVGISIALVLPFALWLLLPGWRSPAQRLPPLAWLIVVIPLMYVGLMWAYLRMTHDEIVAGFPWAELVRDWRGIAIILVRLIGFGLSRLLFGFYQPAWLGPPASYATVAALAPAVLGVALVTRGEARRRLAAVVLLIIACYGVIAFGRAALLRKVPQDMLSTLFRYHYVGQLLFSVLLCLLLARIGWVPRWVRHGALAAWYAVSLALWAELAPPLDAHTEARLATQSTLAEIDEAIGAQPAGSQVYLQNMFFEGLHWYPTAFPGRAAAFIIFYPGNVVDGRRVRFVESNRYAVEQTKDGRRTAGLLVLPSPPASAPPLAPPACFPPALTCGGPAPRAPQ